MWAWVAGLLDRVFAPIFWVLSWLDPVAQGIVLGVPVALLALLIYRVASDQNAITRTKDQIKGQLLALRLFQDDIRVLLVAQAKIFRLVLHYLRLALLPMAILFIPVVLLLIQVESRFALRPVAVDEPTLITVELDSLRPTQVEADLLTPAGVAVETKGLRLDSERQIVWRLSASRPGAHMLSVRVGDESDPRWFWVGGDRPQLLDGSTYRANDVRSLMSPAEAPISGDSVVARITIHYPEAPNMIAGLSFVTWLVFGSSLVFGFVLRGPLKVDF